MRCLQLFAALQEAKASSILAVGSVNLLHVGSYLRSKYGYMVLLRQANVAKRPKAYLRMLRHSYLVCRGLDGADGEQQGAWSVTMLHIVAALCSRAHGCWALCRCSRTCFLLLLTPVSLPRCPQVLMC